jgi:hypothetical protein
MGETRVRSDARATFLRHPVRTRDVWKTVQNVLIPARISWATWLVLSKIRVDTGEIASFGLRRLLLTH